MSKTKATKALVSGFAALLVVGGASIAPIGSAEAQSKAGLGANYQGTPGVYRGPGGGGGFGGGRVIGGGGGHRGAVVGGGGHGGGYGHGYVGNRGYVHRHYRGRRGYGGAVAAGVVGGLALGALAAGSSPYYYDHGYAPAYYGGYGYGPAYAGECYLVNQERVNRYGEIVIRQVQVCE